MSESTVKETNSIMREIMKKESPDAPTINRMMAGSQLFEACDGESKHDGSGKLEDLPDTPENIPWGKGSKRAKAKKKIIKRIPKTTQGDDDYNDKSKDDNWNEDVEDDENLDENVGTPSRVKKLARVGTTGRKKGSAGTDLEFSKKNKSSNHEKVEIKRWGSDGIRDLGNSLKTPKVFKYEKNGKRNIQRFHNTNL